MEDNRVDTLQLVFNYLDQRMVGRVFPAAREKEIGIIAREPLACGLLSGKYEEAHDYITELHRNSEPNAASAFLAYRIARHVGNRDDEARYLAQMRKKFSDSDEYRNLLQGAPE